MKFCADTGIEKDPAKMKQFVLSKLGNVSSKIKAVLEQTDLNSMIWSQLKFRHPWELLWGNISRDAVCVAGDALHPMTPDIGQGGCSALEDGIVLARVLSEALTRNSGGVMPELEHRRVVVGLGKFADERKWRIIKLVAVAFVVGYVQQSNGIVISFLRDRVVARFLAGLLLKMSDFNCGGLSLNS